MAPPLFSLHDVSVAFDNNPLFTDITLHIQNKDRICLVGRNGAGKTTLFKLIMGEVDLKAGRRWSAPAVRIGYLPQTTKAVEAISVRDYVLSGLKKEEQTEDKLYLADIVIDPLQLTADEPMTNLSGGQIQRAALARALVASPDILLLDEPTNHLDIETIQWLEQYLSNYDGALLCISHDRAFLSNISRKVFWLDKGTIRTCPHGYANFEEWVVQIREQEYRELVNLGKRIDDEASKRISARRKRNERRLRELQEMRAQMRADRAAYNQSMNTIKLDPAPASVAAKIVCEFKHAYKSFTSETGQEKPILKDFNLRLIRGDKIGIVGKNGSGKTTFLRVMTGEVELDEGIAKMGKKLEVSYADQRRKLIDTGKTLWENLCPQGGDHLMVGDKYMHVVGYLKRFMFTPEEVKNKASTLSGGQLNRLMLAKTLANPGNVLILDEPTNDLDMDTLDMLQEMLSDYKGTLFVVSHDRDFLDRVVTKTLVFEGDGVIEGYMGGYSDYLEAKKEKRKRIAGKKLRATKDAAKNNDGSNKTAPEDNNNGGKKSKNKCKMSFKDKHELKKLPETMAKLEQAIATCNDKLADPKFYIDDPEGFDKITRALEMAKAELEKSETRWLELEVLREELGED